MTPQVPSQCSYMRMKQRNEGISRQDKYCDAVSSQPSISESDIVISDCGFLAELCFSPYRLAPTALGARSGSEFIFKLSGNLFAALSLHPSLTRVKSVPPTFPDASSAHRAINPNRDVYAHFDSR